VKWFHKRQKQIYLLIAGVLILGSFAGFGGYFFTSSPLDAAVVVGERKIPYKRFQAIYERALEQQRAQGGSPTDQQREMLKREMVQALVQESIFLDEADRYGVVVTDQELAQMIQTVPEFQTQGRFDPSRYQQVLAQMRLSIPDFEDEQRRQVRIQKTQFLMASGVKITPMEFDRAIRQALGEAKPEDRKKILENPEALRQQWRGRQIQACLQEWYNAVSPQMKVRVQIDKLEGKSPVG